MEIKTQPTRKYIHVPHCTLNRQSINQSINQSIISRLLGKKARPQSLSVPGRGQHSTAH